MRKEQHCVFQSVKSALRFMIQSPLSKLENEVASQTTVEN